MARRPHHVYLVPGFFGFANLGELRYFTHIREFLAGSCHPLGIGARIHLVKTFPTSSLPRRAAHLAEAIVRTWAPGEGPIHLIGHSSGGLDVRLLTTPGAALPTRVDVERIARGVRSVVTVAAPHHGTPVASFFASLLGQQLLRVLSLATIYVLRFGHMPVSVFLQLGAVLARVDRHVGVNSALLDQLFGQLLENFSPERRRAVQTFFSHVGRDQALIPQLTPEGMDVFNAATRDRPGVRYGAVITRGHPPGVLSTLSAGLDPSAQASHAVYHALYRLAARMPKRPALIPTPAQARALRAVFGVLPPASANDGVVPTLSQVWGEVVHAVEADHLDVIGHFGDPLHVPPHYDWLATGSGFTRQRFEALWTDVLGWLVGQRPRRARARRPPRTAANAR
jgi:hypothetical protein